MKRLYEVKLNREQGKTNEQVLVEFLNNDNKEGIKAARLSHDTFSFFLLSGFECGDQFKALVIVDEEQEYTIFDSKVIEYYVFCEDGMKGWIDHTIYADEKEEAIERGKFWRTLN